MLKANNDVDHFTGDLLTADTTEASIPIYIIKEVNVKLTERLQLLDLVKYQNIQIDNYKRLTEINNNTIEYYKNNLIEANNINIALNKSLKEEIRKTNILKYTTVGLLAATVISIITISLTK